MLASWQALGLAFWITATPQTETSQTETSAVAALLWEDRYRNLAVMNEWLLKQLLETARLERDYQVALQNLAQVTTQAQLAQQQLADLHARGAATLACVGELLDASLAIPDGVSQSVWGLLYRSLAVLAAESGPVMLCRSAVLGNSRLFVQEVLRHNGEALQWVSASLRQDKELVLQAVRQSGKALAYVPLGLRGDQDVLYAAREAQRAEAQQMEVTSTDQ